MKLPLIRPDITYEEVAADVEAILRSGQLTSGPYVAAFEAQIAAAVGVEHAVTTTSATTALHLALAAVGVLPGDEVLVSDFTFPASGNVIVQLGAIPVLVDSEPDRFVLDLDDAKSKVTARTRAIMPVDPFGQPAPMTAVVELANAHDLAVVEDAACALGSSIDGKACGSWPGAGCFSFHPRKVVTTGEGGAVATNDAALAARLRLLRNHGGEPGGVGQNFVENGFNYRLGEIPAALGSAQLRRLDEIIGDRRRAAACYSRALDGVVGVTVPHPAENELWTHQSFVVMLDDAIDRDGVQRALGAREIETTLGTYAMHAHPSFARFGYSPGDLPNAWRYQQQSLTLPLPPRLTEADVERVVRELEVAISKASA